MSDMIERLGAVLGPGYRVERELGGGGMSLVFLTYDTALERSIDEREPFLYSSSLTAPWWRELRSDSGFLALAARMGVRISTPGNGAR